MSKMNGLFKKVELFERLAVYGDRFSFLKSLAQDTTLSSVDKDALAALTGNISALESTKPNLKGLNTSNLLNAAQSNPLHGQAPFDMDMLKAEVAKAAQALSDAVGSSDPRATQAKELSARLNVGPLKSQMTENVSTLPTTEVVSSNPKIIALQAALNKLNPANKLELDGDLGPLTEAAIKSFMGQFGITDRAQAVKALQDPKLRNTNNAKQEITNILQTAKTVTV